MLLVEEYSVITVSQTDLNAYIILFEQHHLSKILPSFWQKGQTFENFVCFQASDSTFVLTLSENSMHSYLCLCPEDEGYLWL